jgi:hypothetical protein
MHLLIFINHDDSYTNRLKILCTNVIQLYVSSSYKCPSTEMVYPHT